MRSSRFCCWRCPNSFVKAPLFLMLSVRKAAQCIKVMIDMFFVVVKCMTILLINNDSRKKCKKFKHDPCCRSMATLKKSTHSLPSRTHAGEAAEAAEALELHLTSLLILHLCSREQWSKWGINAYEIPRYMYIYICICIYTYILYIYITISHNILYELYITKPC